MDEGVITAARVASKIYQTFFHLNPRQAILATKNAGIDINEAQAPVASAAGARTTFAEGNVTTTANLPSPCGEPSYVRAAAVTDMKAQTSTLPEGQSWLTPSLNGLQSRLPLSPRFLKAVNKLIGTDKNRRALSFAISNALGVIERNLCNLGVVAGTAAGKSLCWQVDALASLRTDTPSFLLLVVPYVALIADVERVCKEKAIACEPWTKPFHLGPSSPNVVVISLNRAVSSTFLQWVSGQEVQAAMRRVVVDEAHVLIDETFRSTLGDFAKLTERLSSKQFVFLSATIPPDREYELERVTCLPIRFLRDATHRPNLAYSLVEVNNFKTAVTHIKATAAVTATGSHADNQVLVICRTKMLAREVAALLGAALFYSESEANPREREEMLKGLQQWLQGLTRILVGTVAASVGIDRPHVRLVAFLDEPYSLSSFVQAAGRAGRDGLPADVVLFKMREVTGPLPKGPHPRTDDEAVALLLAGERCMREPVTEWMDGRVASCLELGGEWCSVCREMYDEHPPVMTTSATRAVALGERKEGKRKLEDTEDQHISPTPRLVVPGFVYQNGSYEISVSNNMANDSCVKS
ncbi:hypothetical protein CF319_g9217 [Tilletia indica]|nr:hypothetical protein CF319_g9217 [Tilletia indica]